MSNSTPPMYRRKVTVDYDPDDFLTEQHHLEQCSIQHIMARYRKTGLIDHVNNYAGTYGDFANAPTFQEAQNIIADARTMFETVPATIRAEFDNDPTKYIEFMQNPENKQQIEDMGLDASHLRTPHVYDTPTPNPSADPKTPPAPSEALSGHSEEAASA